MRERAKYHGLPNQPELEAIADAVKKTREDAAKLGVDIGGLIASLSP